MSGILLATTFGVGRILPFLLIALFAVIQIRKTNLSRWKAGLRYASTAALLVVSFYYGRLFLMTI